MRAGQRSRSLAVRIASLALRIYQLFVSPVLHALGGSGCGCRFHPTCSCYAKDALATHGFNRGFLLATKRLLRCHPWSPGGYDPVPDLKSRGDAAIGEKFKSNLDG